MGKREGYDIRECAIYLASKWNDLMQSSTYSSKSQPSTQCYSSYSPLSKPSKPDRRQIKGGLLLHTKVLGELYKKREREDLKKQTKVEAGRIQRVKGKRKQVAKKRIKTKKQQSVTPIVSESSGDESSTREEEQVLLKSNSAISSSSSSHPYRSTRHSINYCIQGGVAISELAET
ncbi:hypothetical protein HOY80DRAFT_1052931 [Tuber brumale]|nr:hypothetical protein HOY80DRAFT_1052931 [Tuber brumale]